MKIKEFESSKIVKILKTDNMGKFFFGYPLECTVYHSLIYLDLFGLKQVQKDSVFNVDMASISNYPNLGAKMPLSRCKK